MAFWYCWGIIRLFTQKLFEEWLDRGLPDLAFCGFYYWKPAVEFPPEFGCGG